MKYHLFTLACLLGIASVSAQSLRETILLDEDWQFALGNAASPEKDFGCGTEYFNYLTKAASIHNQGPYSPQFQPEMWGVKWKTINLPHDWAVDLPFAAGASHSHGYKTVGYKYPENSVGWYRKTFSLPEEDLGKHLRLRFDGIFRDARVWVNGFYVGHEPSGYAVQLYDISEYLNYGGENLICVRVDATLEEGWFYEGAGIYRHVWLEKEAPLHVALFGTFVQCHFPDTLHFNQTEITIETHVENSGVTPSGAYRLCHYLMDESESEVARTETMGTALPPKGMEKQISHLTVTNPHLWSVDSPYLYHMVTEVYEENRLVDSYTTPFGIRHIAFDANRGFLLNGTPVKLKGVNMHQDHAGVGAGIPDALQVYRLEQLKFFGCNAYRSSHNPMTPELLDACDRLGILVVEENRLMGVNEEHIRLLCKMIERDRNHPCIILWSMGNEEWGIERNELGERIIASMREYSHGLDPTRPVTVASSGGANIIIPADVAGYNYIRQNPVDDYHQQYPERCAIGTEETSGCGTRGVYFQRKRERRRNEVRPLSEVDGWMVSLNREPNGPDSSPNSIEQGWKFYEERPWLGGLFYWTGFDYRGEPNPLGFPATGSQYGILDYCGFPKDEAYYLKAWWGEEPVLHLSPHWNLQGHEEEEIDVWAYSNCDEVELFVNGNTAGRQTMPKNGHLSWHVVYQPGALKAVGYKGGKKVLTEEIETTEEAALTSLTANRTTIQADNRDVAVVRIELQDKQGRFVPTACEELTLTVSGPIRILGVGNGNPAYQATERPEERDARTYRVKTFNGLAQVLLQSTGEPGEAQLIVSSDALSTASIQLQTFSYR